MRHSVVAAALALLTACSQAPPPIVGVWDKGQSSYAAFLANGEIYDCGPRAVVGHWRAVGGNRFQLVVTDHGQTDTALATVNSNFMNIQITSGSDAGDLGNWTRAQELGVCS